jgi:superoxide reductase
MTYWMCDKCSFVIESPKPPDPCPSCQIKCAFNDVTCYTPECGGLGSLDSKLVAQRVMKKEKPGKVVHFSDLVRGRTSEGREKHVPSIELIRGQGKMGKDLVEIVVGREAPHPNTVEHYIVWIQAFGAKKDGHVLDLGREVFKPEKGKPFYAFEIDSSQFKHIFSFSYCTLHGVWEQHLEL